MKPKLADFSTAELVKELSEREGVVKTAVEPYQRYRFTGSRKGSHRCWAGGRALGMGLKKHNNIDILCLLCYNKVGKAFVKDC